MKITTYIVATIGTLWEKSQCLELFSLFSLVSIFTLLQQWTNSEHVIIIYTVSVLIHVNIIFSLIYTTGDNV